MHQHHHVVDLMHEMHSMMPTNYIAILNFEGSRVKLYTCLESGGGDVSQAGR